MVDIVCEVVGHKPLTEVYREMDLSAPEIAGQARPGQFVHVRVPGIGAASLRRPFSIFGADCGRLKILYKNVGRGTAEMTRLRTGDKLQVIGPLGNGFPLEPEGEALLVAGGYGVAPLFFLAGRLPRAGVALIGGRAATDILAREDFERIGWRVRVATQDGSLGEKGLVTDLLDRELERLRQKGLRGEIFACGPEGMSRAVGERAAAAGMRGWLSLDKRMVCGVGACLACVQKLRRADGSTWIGRVCHDGPVFEAREIVW
ncbi:MAG: dihydroorotate dehydrogenase electron transfer subunit [Kiritimatiellae bacterium]|nr:dihydroorotate dehydrogenase electron transfer subunit [Kiritimatiellia bacterium]